MLKKECKTSYLLIIGIPREMKFGIDYMTWTVTSKFMGIKNIPPGVHYIHTTNFNSNARIGFFISTKPGTVIVKTWDDTNSFLTNMNNKILEEKIKRSTLNEDFDKYMGLYPYETLCNWKRLSIFITPKIISKLSPINLNGSSSEIKKYKNFRKIDQYYTSIPNFYCYKDDCTPQQITKINVDKTEMLEQILKNMSNSYNNYLGELNYAFVSFLLGQCFESLDQWRQMTEILLDCENGLETHKELFIRFIDLLHNQLKDIPYDFFKDPLLNRNFLQSGLVKLLRNLENLKRDERMEFQYLVNASN